MKNTHIKAGQEVPIELRKEIYREALDFIIKNPLNKSGFNYERDLKGNGLCVLLPVLLWGLNKFSDSLSNGEDWFYKDTILLFPELESFLSDGCNGEYTELDRINFLKSVI